MPVRTITITEDAYRGLKRLKRKGESFSRVIRRLARTRSALALVGALSPAQGEAMESAVARTRRDVDEGVKRCARGMRT